MGESTLCLLVCVLVVDFMAVCWRFSDMSGIRCTCGGEMFFLCTSVCTPSEEELVTPLLDGLTLPGVMRKSLLQLAREWVSLINFLHCVFMLSECDCLYLIASAG